MSWGFLYLAKGDGVCKIGYTRNPRRRARELSGGKWNLKITHVWFLPRHVDVVEARVYNSLAHRHAEGEIFKITEQGMLRAIKRVLGPSDSVPK